MINARNWPASILLLSSFSVDAACPLLCAAPCNYFQEAFPKYDDLNESVQENVSAIRVVKAYVRGDHETKRFRKASQNIYNMLLKAESQCLVWNSPLMQFTVYTLHSF